MTPQEQLQELITRLDQLSLQQQRMSNEIIHLRGQINRLKGIIKKEEKATPEAESSTPTTEIPEIKIDFEKLKQRTIPPPLPVKPVSADESSVKPTIKGSANKNKAFDLERFIGGNLINKIGILILIIGLGLFTKYAIDNGYFPPIVRLVGSFLAGLTLVLLGYRLKPKYKTYSAVLFSGGMAVLYFSAYGGHAFYDPSLLPRTTAFILMVVFTVVTVLAALMYNLQIIALLGMVGAYSVPLFLSNDSGNYVFFLGYIAIINTGILLVSLRQFWRGTLYVSLILTWITFAFWVLVEYDPAVETTSAWIFNILFFGLFYTALVAYNLRNKRKFSVDNIMMTILNAFIFYGLGMYLLENSDLQRFQGLFTLSNGLVHLGLAYALYRPPSDKLIFYTLTGLFWLFLTIAIGVEFDAANLALLWLGEAVLLFYIGRRSEVAAFEIGSYLLLFLGGIMLVNYWDEGYFESLVHLRPLANSYFGTSCLALLGIGVMLWISQRWKGNTEIGTFSNAVVGSVFVILLYAMMFNEIYHQASMSYLNSFTNNRYQSDLLSFRNLWLLYYSLSFVLGMGLLNHFWLKQKALTWMTLILSLLLIAVFLTMGLYELNLLRTNYLTPAYTPEFEETSKWIWIRYLGYGLVAGIAYLVFQTVHKLDLWERSREWLNLGMHGLILVFLSNELTTFMAIIAGVDIDSLAHRVGYSILWALYALMLIFIGFRKRSKLLRIAGIALFALTLLKIFLVDLIDISTESRIFLFVAVGVLLLVTSYLYQKYAEVLLGEERKDLD